MPKPPPLKLRVLDDLFAICQLDREQAVPEWVQSSPFYSVSHTDRELSIICSEDCLPAGIRAEKGWRCLRIADPYPLDFSLIGILASLLGPLAAAGIPILAVSTYDTDYVLIEDEQLNAALRVLEQHGFEIVQP